MSIKAVDRRTVHQICSGQVVLSLAVAVKELVENSLDAGATNIEVRLKEYGSEVVEVTDNGCGVDPVNFEALALKHHTSKLRDFSDLTSVATFGFRGEALSSLCALSDLVVTTCHKSQSVGTRLEYDSDGHFKKKASCAREVGTSVLLHNLFYTLPVRYKEFQRNLKKEYAKMVQMLQGYCLISTGVRIACYNQTGKGKKQLVLSTNGNATIKENIVNVFGPKQLQQLVEVSQCSLEDANLEEDSISKEALQLFRLSGYVSRCNHGYGRSATDRQFFFFNSRPCDHQKLSKTVNEVYHTYNRHQYPFVVLSITTAREHVDVNVTPDKRQVMLYQEKALLLVVKTSLMKLFEPMQSQYDTHQTQTATGSAGSETSCAGDGIAGKISSLKRAFSYANADTVAESEPPKPKQPKLFDYGLTRTPGIVVTPDTHFTDDKSQHQDHDASALHQRGESQPDSGVSCSSDSQKSSQSSTQSQNFTLAEILEPSESAAAVVQDELGSSSQHRGNQSPLQVSAMLSGEMHSTSFEVDESQRIDGLASLLTVSSHKASLKIQGFDSTSGSSTLHDGSSETREGSRLVGGGARPCVSIKMDSDELYRRRVEHKREVVFNLEKITSRLEALRSGDFSRPGQAAHRGFRAAIRPSDNANAEDELRREISKDMFAEMEVIGQFNLGFIIARLQEDLFIVDQHATDEKFKFEKLQNDTMIQHQRLLQPMSLELTAVNETIVMENLEVFRMNGFHFDIDPDALPSQRVKLAAHPVSKNWSLGTEDIEELVFLLTDCPGGMVRPSRLRAMFATRACRSAVMIGTPLNKSQMRKLILHMGESNQPWNCPHGRPTMRHLVDLGKLQEPQ